MITFDDTVRQVIYLFMCTYIDVRQHVDRLLKEVLDCVMASTAISTSTAASMSSNIAADAISRCMLNHSYALYHSVSVYVTVCVLRCLCVCLYVYMCCWCACLCAYMCCLCVRIFIIIVISILLLAGEPGEWSDFVVLNVVYRAISKVCMYVCI